LPENLTVPSREANPGIPIPIAIGLKSLNSSSSRVFLNSIVISSGI